jgi:sporulation protein YlmC with PRC-barrel domain
MAIDLSGVQTGMDVLDPAGEKIGSISDIVDVQAYSATDTTSSYDDPATGGTSDIGVTTVTPNPSAEKTYLKVNQGGVLGIGAKELYIPFNSVKNIAPGDSVTVDCTKDTCGDMYGNKPDFLP